MPYTLKWVAACSEFIFFDDAMMLAEEQKDEIVGAYAAWCAANWPQTYLGVFCHTGWRSSGDFGILGLELRQRAAASDGLKGRAALQLTLILGSTIRPPQPMPSTARLTPKLI